MLMNLFHAFFNVCFLRNRLLSFDWHYFYSCCKWKPFSPSYPFGFHVASVISLMLRDIGYVSNMISIRHEFCSEMMVLDVTKKARATHCSTNYQCTIYNVTAWLDSCCTFLHFPMTTSHPTFSTQGNKFNHDPTRSKNEKIIVAKKELCAQCLQLAVNYSAQGVHSGVSMSNWIRTSQKLVLFIPTNQHVFWQSWVFFRPFLNIRSALYVKSKTKQCIEFWLQKTKELMVDCVIERNGPVWNTKNCVKFFGFSWLLSSGNPLHEWIC